MKKQFAFVAAVALAGALIVTTNASGATTGPSLGDSVSAAMLSKAGVQGSSLAVRNAGTEVNVQRSSRDWVFGAGVIKAGPDAEAPESWLFVAKRGAKGWEVALEDDGAFSSMVAAAPSTVVSAGEKQTFANWAANSARIASQANAAAAVDTGLMLPFGVGLQANMLGGPHGWSGSPRPWSSIDLNPTDRRILSAQSGRAYYMCANGGHIRIIHDNGWTTEYYHLLNEIKPNGEQYPMGTYLGQSSERIPCGGSAVGNHVHFALKQGSTWSTMQDKTIGGWTWFEGSSAYSGGATRGSVTRYRGDNVQNYGASGGPGGKTFENLTNFNVADQGTADSPITVSGVSGNAPATLSVYADVHHTWRGDLQIDLVAPDGSTYRLRNPNPDDDGDIIHETYTVNASSEVANGVWKLRVRDVAVNDSGYIDGWTITF